MIDFRYHLVSIVAVFLALAIGIVLGSTALQPSVLSGLQQTSQAERRQIDSLYAINGQLRAQVSGDQQFAQAAEAQLVGHLLDGQRVVLVEAPGAPGAVTAGVIQVLSRAGAVITGQVQLQSKFFDPTSTTQDSLAQLAQQLAPAGMTLRSGSPSEQAGQVLASAILTSTGPSQPGAGQSGAGQPGAGEPVAGQPDPVSRAILNGFGAEGFLTVSGTPSRRATLAVVVIPGTPPAAYDSNAASQALVTISQQLNLAGQGTVVAGSVAGSGRGSAIDVMRVDGRSGHLSSVDDADLVIGQVVVAQALAAQMKGVSGSYGTAVTAAAPGPSPAPTPSPSASASASTSVRSAATARGSAQVTPSPSQSGKR